MASVFDGVPQVQHTDFANVLEAFFLGRKEKAERERLALDRTIAAPAAAGNYKGAASLAFEAGDIDLGSKLAGLDIESKAQLAETLTRHAMAAKTPEQWARVGQIVGEQFGPEAAEQWGAWEERDSVIAAGMSAAEQLAQQAREESAGREDTRLGMEAERLRLAQEEADRKAATEATKPPEKTAGENARDVARAKAEEERAAQIQTNAQGAREYLNKVARVREIIGRGGDDLFGPAQGGMAGRIVGRAVGTEAQRMRDELTAALRELELSVAQMKLKGQGQITESERKIARETLPSLTLQDSKAALAILDGLEAEAKRTIELRQNDGDLIAKPGGAPEGVPQEIWDEMTPEERANWES